jgi:poly-gamma-glutamate capsule biosynthesis protein CapA/YwtB (metallophosphatase superfamily)
VIKILFCGDFAPCGKYERLVERYPNKIFGDALELIKTADISFVNLECVLTDKSNNKIFKKGPNLKASGKCVKALKNFTVVGLANNHILDYGEQGLSDTLLNCKNNNIQTVGVETNCSDNKRVFYKETRGVIVAIIAVAEKEFNFISDSSAEVNIVDPIDTSYQIKEAKEKADVVIVTIHGGNEYFPYPNPQYRKLCRYFVDLGVNAVICHHPHVPGAHELYKGAPIFYSLGNFIFDAKQKPEGWDYGYMVELCFNKTDCTLSSFKILPYVQSVDNLGVRMLKAAEKNVFLSSVDNLRKILENEKTWLKEWKEFATNKHKYVLIDNYSPILIRGIGTLGEILPLHKYFVNRFNIKSKINISRCSSHQELLKFALEERFKDYQ